jgi:NADH dehydrogenase
MSANQRPTVIVIGAGFGGLYATKKLAKADVDILLIDRHNFHLFSPLVYQVATSGLEAGEIAYPVRGILRNQPHVRFLMGSVEDIDVANKSVLVKTNTKTIRESFDYLLISAGSQTNFFGMEQAKRYAFDLKDLGHAIVLRNHVLKCFENAAWTEDPARREALTTMVVVGAAQPAWKRQAHCVSCTGTC